MRRLHPRSSSSRRHHRRQHSLHRRTRTGRRRRCTRRRASCRQASWLPRLLRRRTSSSTTTRTRHPPKRWQPDGSSSCGFVTRGMITHTSEAGRRPRCQRRARCFASTPATATPTRSRPSLSTTEGPRSGRRRGPCRTCSCSGSWPLQPQGLRITSRIRETLDDAPRHGVTTRPAALPPPGNHSDPTTATAATSTSSHHIAAHAARPRRAARRAHLHERRLSRPSIRFRKTVTTMVTTAAPAGAEAAWPRPTTPSHAGWTTRACAPHHQQTSTTSSSQPWRPRSEKTPRRCTRRSSSCRRRGRGCA